MVSSYSVANSVNGSSKHPIFCCHSRLHDELVFALPISRCIFIFALTSQIYYYWHKWVLNSNERKLVIMIKVMAYQILYYIFSNSAIKALFATFASFSPTLCCSISIMEFICFSVKPIFIPI